MSAVALAVISFLPLGDDGPLLLAYLSAVLSLCFSSSAARRSSQGVPWSLPRRLEKITSITRWYSTANQSDIPRAATAA